MSVTQNYKTFKLSASDEVIRYIVAAVMMQLAIDKDRLKSVKDYALAEFLRMEIAKGGEAVAALNVESTREDTHGVLGGEMLETVLSELHVMRLFLVECSVKAPGNPARLARLDAALLFLESQK